MKRLHISLAVQPDRVPEPDFPHCGPAHARHAKTFKLQAQRYRNRKRAALLLTLGFLLGCAVLTNNSIGRAAGLAGFGVLVTCWAGAVGLALFGLGLTCPACRKRLLPAKGRYCPQCGSDQFDGGSHRRGPAQSRFVFCPACGGTIHDGDNEQPRAYRVRGCTHCGVLLDESGV